MGILDDVPAEALIAATTALVAALSTIGVTGWVARREGMTEQERLRQLTKKLEDLGLIEHDDEPDKAPGSPTV